VASVNSAVALTDTVKLVFHIRSIVEAGVWCGIEQLPTLENRERHVNLSAFRVVVCSATVLEDSRVAPGHAKENPLAGDSGGTGPAAGVRQFSLLWSTFGRRVRSEVHHAGTDSGGARSHRTGASMTKPSTSDCRSAEIPNDDWLKESRQVSPAGGSI